MEKEGTSLSWTTLGWVLVAYFLATMAMTFPLASRWLHEIPGPPEDNLQGLWNLWWVRKSILTFHQSPIITDYLYYPQGINLAFHTFSFFNALLGVPLQSLFNDVATYNVLWFLSFPLSALGAFVLAYETSGHLRGSFLAGWCFAFSAYHFAHSGHHLNLNSIQFIPWYAWSLKKMARDPTLGRGLVTGLFFVATSLCSWYYGIYLGFFTLLWMITIVRGQQAGLDRALLCASTVAGFGLFPFLSPMIKRILTEAPGVLYEVAPSRLGGDLLAYFIPAPEHSIFRGWNVLGDFYGRLAPFPWEGIVFLGVVPLGFGLFAALRFPWKKTCLWSAGLVFFWILSLGPELRLNGISLVGHLPYEWLVERVPILKMVRVPSRFVVMCTLSLSVLLAMGYSRFEIKVARGMKKGKWVVWAVVFALLVMETVHVPLRTINPSQISRADLFQGIKQEDHGKAILELPMKGYVFNLIYLFRQTVHEKRLLFGILSRVPDESTRWIREGPLLNFFIPTKELNKEFVHEMVEKLREIDVGYIVLNGPFFRRQGIEGENMFKQLKYHLDRSAIGTSRMTAQEFFIYKIPSN
jgi:hypothetical protein